MEINQSIFKAYDIRGMTLGQLTPEIAYRIGRAFGNYIHITVLNRERAPVIVVNNDARISSPALKTNLMRGLLDEQCHVLDCGLSTTPMHTFAMNHLDADGGIMVTASHNPAEYNGFKLSRRGSVAVGLGTGMEEIRNAVVHDVFPLSQGKGSSVEQNVTDAYLDFIFNNVDLDSIRGFKIVCDTGNGMVGLLLPLFLKRLPLDMHVLFGDIDMTFPNHEANPLQEETLQSLKKALIEEKADIGIAFDGDGDRVRFVTPSGLAVSGDIILALFAQWMMNGDKVHRHASSSFVYTVNSSRIVKETIEESGGIAIESRIGHAFVTQAMREHNAVLGGEVSGHFYWRDFFFAESALKSLLVMLDLLAHEKKSLEDLVRPLLKYVTSGEVNVNVEHTNISLDAVAAHYQDAVSVRHVDGISVVYDDFWFNVRLSNTEPLLRITMEAKEKNVLDARLQELRLIINRL